MLPPQGVINKPWRHDCSLSIVCKDLFKIIIVVAFYSLVTHLMTAVEFVCILDLIFVLFYFASLQSCPSCVHVTCNGRCFCWRFCIENKIELATQTDTFSSRLVYLISLILFQLACQNICWTSNVRWTVKVCAGLVSTYADRRWTRHWYNDIMACLICRSIL